MSEMIFFDSEFTDLSASASLISAGFVAVTGEEFYVELSDFKESDCNDFVITTVLPMLTQNRMTTNEFVQQLLRWLDKFDGDVVLVADSEWDRKILNKSFASVGMEIPSGWIFRRVQDYFPTGRQHQIFNDEMAAYFLRNPAEKPHHALSDARAARRAYFQAETAY